MSLPNDVCRCLGERLYDGASDEVCELRESCQRYMDKPMCANVPCVSWCCDDGLDSYIPEED